MIFTDKIEYALSFQTKIKLSTENLKKVLNALGRPQDNMKYIHVTGTNGKGSVCAFLEKMLISANINVGKFVSPELVKKNEMISFSGVNITDEDLTHLIEKVTSVCSENSVELSPFEIICSVMFLYFSERNCKIVILETGMGGLGDGTNVIDESLVSVITRIGIDHTEYLGKTIKEITRNKCGIIKENSKAVTLNDNGDFKIISDICAEKNCELYIANPLETAGFTHINEYIIYKGNKVKISLAGEHQLENASLATTVGEILGLNVKDIIFGLENAENNGRFEKLKNNLYFDGAHNENGAKALRRNIDKYMPETKKTYIMGVMKDKEFEKILGILNDGYSDFIFVTVKNNPRAMNKEDMLYTAKKSGIKGKIEDDINELIKGELKTPVIICGSLYLYKEIDKEGIKNESF